MCLWYHGENHSHQPSRIVMALRVRSLMASLAGFLAHILMEKQYNSHLGYCTSRPTDKLILLRIRNHAIMGFDLS